MCLHVSTTFSNLFLPHYNKFTVPYFIGHVIDKQKIFKACKLPSFTEHQPQYLISFCLLTKTSNKDISQVL